MILASLMGYVLVLALAVAFLRLGVQGCGSKGLPLTHRVTLKGWPSHMLGIMLILVGAGIFFAGGNDFVNRYFTSVSPENDSDSIEITAEKPGQIPPLSK